MLLNRQLSSSSFSSSSSSFSPFLLLLLVLLLTGSPHPAASDCSCVRQRLRQHTPEALHSSPMPQLTALTLLHPSTTPRPALSLPHSLTPFSFHLHLALVPPTFTFSRQNVCSFNLQYCHVAFQGLFVVEFVCIFHHSPFIVHKGARRLRCICIVPLSVTLHPLPVVNGND